MVALVDHAPKLCCRSNSARLLSHLLLVACALDLCVHVTGDSSVPIVPPAASSAPPGASSAPPGASSAPPGASSAPVIGPGGSLQEERYPAIADGHGDGHGGGETGGHAGGHGEVHRFQVAKLDFGYVKNYFMVAIFVLFACGAKICEYRSR